MAIHFYKVADKFGCFSNFSNHGFNLDDKFWRTSEHYFQAMKFKNTEISEQIRLLSSPMEAARMGRNRSNPLRDDWEDIKDDVMRKAVWNKFNQNIDIAEILLSTGNEEIIEKTSSDYYWGCGTEGTGKNMLGILLMETRERLTKS